MNLDISDIRTLLVEYTKQFRHHQLKICERSFYTSNEFLQDEILSRDYFQEKIDLINQQLSKRNIDIYNSVIEQVGYKLDCCDDCKIEFKDIELFKVNDFLYCFECFIDHLDDELEIDAELMQCSFCDVEEYDMLEIDGENYCIYHKPENK